MNQLGLDSLLNQDNPPGVAPTIYASDLQSLALSDNPFTATTMLRSNLGKAAYIRTEGYDELGRTIIADGTGKVYDPGLHQQQLDLSKVASGVYYLRISAGDGETRTVKMVRRE